MTAIQQAATDRVIWERRIQYHLEHGDHQSFLRRFLQSPFPLPCPTCAALREEEKKARQRVDAELVAEARSPDAGKVWT